MKHEDIKNILLDTNYVGQNITICGWVKSIRKFKNICFIDVNDGTSLKNLQLVLDYSQFNNVDIISDINVGSSVVAIGNVVNSMNANQNIELNVYNIKVLGNCAIDYPIQKKKQNMEFLREVPHLRVRTNTFNAVFKVRNMLIKSIHDYFQSHNFTYINTPIITGSNCEGAGQMFRVTTLDIEQISRDDYQQNLASSDFFGKKVGLTLSGQLEAEAMACGLGKVYTFGPAFRAENSNTKKHAAEFWMVEPEVAFADLDDIIEIISDEFKYMIKTLLVNCNDEISFFTKYYDCGLYKRLTSVVQDDFASIEYTDAIELLINSKNNFQYPLYWGCDLKYEHIRYLTDEVYGTPLFIRNYPKELKPFYVKQNEDGRTVASADLFFPGIGDIVGACQKEDNFELLDKRISELKMTKEDYLWYLDLRKYGTVPHSGYGMGLERLVMYTTGIDNIRDTIPFPRTKCKKLKL